MYDNVMMYNYRMEASYLNIVKCDQNCEMS